jgi:hypothetical protein
MNAYIDYFLLGVLLWRGTLAFEDRLKVVVEEVVCEFLRGRRDINFTLTISGAMFVWSLYFLC